MRKQHFYVIYSLKKAFQPILMKSQTLACKKVELFQKCAQDETTIQNFQDHQVATNFYHQQIRQYQMKKHQISTSMLNKLIIEDKKRKEKHKEISFFSHQKDNSLSILEENKQKAIAAEDKQKAITAEDKQKATKQIATKAQAILKNLSLIEDLGVGSKEILQNFKRSQPMIPLLASQQYYGYLSGEQYNKSNDIIAYYVQDLNREMVLERKDKLEKNWSSSPEVHALIQLLIDCHCNGIQRIKILTDQRRIHDAFNSDKASYYKCQQQLEHLHQISQLQPTQSATQSNTLTQQQSQSVKYNNLLFAKILSKKFTTFSIQKISPEFNSIANMMVSEKIKEVNRKSNKSQLEKQSKKHLQIF